MRKYLILFAAAALCAPAFGQEAQSLTQADPFSFSKDTSAQTLSEVLVDAFEREGTWVARISPDDGFISSSHFDGTPSNKTPLPQVGDAPAPEDTKIFGVKVEFYHRGINPFYVTPLRPIPIEGVVKTVSVWVAGRNQNHRLVLLVQDYNGRTFELPMGNLNYTGWKLLTAVVPASPDGVVGIVQNSPYYGDKPGFRVAGFRVDCDPSYTLGTYYIYFDDLRAVTDLYFYDSKDTDDPQDTW